jgi:predicted GIY-YIG superfamily endonuclease
MTGASAMTAFVYILRCGDGAYYVGTTDKPVEQRVAEHNLGHGNGWTARRRPVTAVYVQEFSSVRDAQEAEQKLKGWSRAKKEALIRGDFDALPSLARSTYRKRKDAEPE